jgi:SWI/SNF-related matrix-associated actin-dependent regulator 1 of chromatin subfamily A
MGLALFSKFAETTEVVNGLAVSLYPFQEDGLKHLIRHPKCILADEMGLGKTFQALAAVEAANAYPCVIIAPSSNKDTWALKEIPKALPHRLVLIADKNTPIRNNNLFALADIIVTNYEQLVGYRTTDSGKRSSHTDHTKRKVVLSDLTKKLQSMPIQSVILDEAHKIKNMSSSTTRSVLSLLFNPDGTPRNIPYRYVLTGTPCVNRPAELAPYLRFLGYLPHFGGHWEFLKRYCGLRKGKYGIEAKAATNSVELNQRLRQLCYIRRLKKDVLKELPPKSRTTLSVEIDNRKEYDKAKDELIDWVQERVASDRVFLQSIATLSTEAQAEAIHERKISKAEAARRAETIVRISALRAVASEGKLKAGIAWIKEFLESNDKLVVFAIHKKVIDGLLKAFPDAARITSDDPSTERYNNVQRFQTDSACKLIVCALGTSAGSSPGGVGHTLTSASNVLFLELGWNPALHDQAEDRCHRIGQTDNVTCHYFIGKQTIDEMLVEIIEGKRAILRQVSDGIEQSEEIGIMDKITEWLLKE